MSIKNNAKKIARIMQAGKHPVEIEGAAMAVDNTMATVWTLLMVANC